MSLAIRSKVKVKGQRSRLQRNVTHQRKNAIRQQRIGFFRLQPIWAW